MAKFKGTESAESIYGTEGNDVIRGLDGNDALIGGDGDDRLFGGDGSDSLYGGAGTDFLSGGDGDDAAFFGFPRSGEADLTHGVHINLAKGYIGNDGFGNVETIRSVESIYVGHYFDMPSPYVDWLRGNAASNVFQGLGDRDQAHGGAGDDSFIFSGANDAVIDGGTGHDDFRLEGTRYVVDPDTGDLVREASRQGMVVDLSRGVIENDGFGGRTDRVTGMESVDTADQDDILIGNDRNNSLGGYKGDDVLIGGRGQDNLYGYSGQDTFVFALGDCGKTDETADIIRDFIQRQGDLIDLSAVSKEIGRTLTFIGEHAFTHTVGEVRYTTEGVDNGHSLIEIDVTGDGQADMAIRTGGGVNVHFTAADFVF